jgi:hypothetical protein
MERMTIKEAFDRGLIKKGARIRTDSHGICTIGCTKSYDSSLFCLIRDDKNKGSCNGADCSKGWTVGNDSGELIEFLDEETTKTSLTASMSTIIDKLNALSQTSEEKLLLKHGIESPLGKPTEDGFKFLMNILYNDHREDIISALQAIEAAEEVNLKKECKK